MPGLLNKPAICAFAHKCKSVEVFSPPPDAEKRERQFDRQLREGGAEFPERIWPGCQAWGGPKVGSSEKGRQHRGRPPGAAEGEKEGGGATRDLSGT